MFFNFYKMTEKADILVIGIGNSHRCDDRIGFFVIDQLQKSGYKDVEFIKIISDGYALMEAWKGRSRVIIVDAAVSGESTGTVHRFDALAEQIPHDLSPVSTHFINLSETIALARTLEQLPEYLHIFAIEGENYNYGEKLTPEVKDAGQRVVEEIINLIELLSDD
ncbi:MAG TPA: hydrogenase maturation protease [Balneolales bacterium]|nr:hydrogenase maturation protease [Balneolales bacterium]